MCKTISWISIIGLSIVSVLTINLTWFLYGLGLWFFFTIVGMFKDDSVGYLDTDEIKRKGRRKRNFESEHFIYDFLYNQKRR